jgi:hypothetical protein
MVQWAYILTRKIFVLDGARIVKGLIRVLHCMHPSRVRNFSHSFDLPLVGAMGTVGMNLFLVSVTM